MERHVSDHKSSNIKIKLTKCVGLVQSRHHLVLPTVHVWLKIALNSNHLLTHHQLLKETKIRWVQNYQNLSYKDLCWPLTNSRHEIAENLYSNQSKQHMWDVGKTWKCLRTLSILFYTLIYHACQFYLGGTRVPI